VFLMNEYLQDGIPAAYQDFLKGAVRM